MSASAGEKQGEQTVPAGTEAQRASPPGQSATKPAEQGKGCRWFCPSLTFLCFPLFSLFCFVFFCFVLVGFGPDAAAAARVGEPEPAPAPHRRRPHSCRHDRKSRGSRTALTPDRKVLAPGWAESCLLSAIDHVSLAADSACHKAAGS